MMAANKPKKQRWYLGGVAGWGAVMITHPLDLVKVHLQTEQNLHHFPIGNKGLIAMGAEVVQNDGVLGLYSGISAAILRQFSYTAVRLGLYEVISSKLLEDRDDCLPFYQKVAISSFAGFIGGIAGNPADTVMVRMQNDMNIPKALRRNYTHAFNGLYRVVAEDGFRTLFAGVTMTASRGALITVGQIAVYDQSKEMLLATGRFADTIPTQFTSSVIAGTSAILVTQPFDVIKTRLMNAKPGEYNSILHCARDIAKSGTTGFLKGFVPAWLRLCPHTTIMWIFLEQLRLMFPLRE